MSASERRPNRLITETSPYLLQHAHNPVDWHPWGPEALGRAKAEDKPILLSIGYAACHWCHVMERESFENDDIAQRMNEGFVCIKVDREERPDLDEIYMAATVAMSGGGGWPMTVFLSPDQRPFFAGTYFPPSDHHGRPGFGSVLERITELWENERESLLLQADELTEQVMAQSKLARASAIDAGAIERAVQQLEATFDPRWGGFGGAPKFPPCSPLELLLRHQHRSRDARSLEMIDTTLTGMKNGGMYDHLAGGFSRYSTDERWLAPHFEKMLYDNAQLARVYAWAFQLRNEPEYARVCRETLDYVAREMQAPDGGYYSATDADSEGEEGKFFVWAPDEISKLLGEPDAERFSAFYDVTPGGNWEGKNILNTPRGTAEVARELGISEDELRASLERGKAKLYAARLERVPPLLDDKILCAWNGLMIGAMAEGARIFGEARYRESAERAAAFVLDQLMRPDGGLYRTARGGKAHLDAYLEDYAYLGDALLDLYEAAGSPEHLKNAERLAERMLSDFGDSEGGAFYFTAHTHEQLVARTREGHDGAVPNANAVAARLLARLSVHLDRPEWRERATAALTAYGQLIERSPRSFATSLGVLDFLVEPPVELVVVGTPEARRPLADELARHYLPNRVIAWVDPEAPPVDGSPLTVGKSSADATAKLFVCRDYACQAPIDEATEIARALGAQHESARDARRARVGTRHLSGHASVEGTRAYADKHADTWGSTGYSELGSTGLSASRLGFGAYRVDAHTAEHAAALEEALETGVNLIDTSTNYTNGESEQLIGEVIAELTRSGKLWRDQLIVVSKIGYVQGKNLELAEERENTARAFPEMVKVGPGLWHCLHPLWLEDQLTRSLDRLGLETLDVCLLHNPEYFFTEAAKRGEGPLSKLREEFYRRLEAAFTHFEQELKRGRLKSYGVSSNTSVGSPDDRDFTDLTSMLAAAKRAGGDEHGFRVLELPFNLLETGAALVEDRPSVLEVAARERIGVLVNRPLNVIAGSGLIRLADAPRLAGASEPEVALKRVADLEQEFKREFAPKLRTGSGNPPPTALFNWAEQLGRLPAAAQTFAEWSQIEREVVLPRTSQVLAALERAMRGEAEKPWREWSARYTEALDQLLSAIRQLAAAHSLDFSLRAHRALEAALPAARRRATLAQKALWVLASTPGVTSVLVGMRRPEYVVDAREVLGWDALEQPLEALRSAAVLGRA
ncbi:MAG: DUF255 domain-containing protein [Myxococcales bacterium]|nr:DUF255 domain-containing protein [Myxococcales bacterium]